MTKRVPPQPKKRGFYLQSHHANPAAPKIARLCPNAANTGVAPKSDSRETDTNVADTAIAISVPRIKGM